MALQRGASISWVVRMSGHCRVERMLWVSTTRGGVWVSPRGRQPGDDEEGVVAAQPDQVLGTGKDLLSWSERAWEYFSIVTPARQLIPVLTSYFPPRPCQRSFPHPRTRKEEGGTESCRNDWLSCHLPSAIRTGPDDIAFPILSLQPSPSLLWDEFPGSTLLPIGLIPTPLGARAVFRLGSSEAQPSPSLVQQLHGFP